MNKDQWKDYIAETYSADAEFPWARHPKDIVFRHGGSRKWFALLLEVPKGKLGLPGDGPLAILNVKCDPVLAGSFLTEPGLYPAYHMNKTNWLSIALDGSVSDDKVKLLLDMSFELTASKGKRRRSQP